MTINAGDLRARLTVTRTILTDRPDGGQDVETVTVLENAPAKVAPLSADEVLRSGLQLATASVRANLRMPKDAAGLIVSITPAMGATVRHGSTGQTADYGIVKVSDLELRGEELELILEARIT